MLLFAPGFVPDFVGVDVTMRVGARDEWPHEQPTVVAATAFAEAILSGAARHHYLTLRTTDMSIVEAVIAYTKVLVGDAPSSHLFAMRSDGAATHLAVAVFPPPPPRPLDEPACLCARCARTLNSA